MGSGSTIAAASRLGIYSIGVECNEEYFHMAKRAIPLLAKLDTNDSAKNRPNRSANLASQPHSTSLNR